MQFVYFILILLLSYVTTKLNIEYGIIIFFIYFARSYDGTDGGLPVINEIIHDNTYLRLNTGLRLKLVNNIDI